MKRRGSSHRRQVLDIDNSGTSWKNKYQQNVFERTINNGIGSKPDVGANPLSKLVGSYTSDSDGEDENVKGKSALDSKVEEFLKEVESTKTSDDASSITCAWQECFDEGTGYPYYWNMNTNEVTWEIPPELVAYQAAMAAKLAQSQAKVKEQAQHAQWAVEQAALGIAPDMSSANKKSSLVLPPPKLKKPPPSKDLAPGIKAKKTHNQRPGRWPASDSEEEKIEMITSWADDESEEDEENENKKGKKSSLNRSEQKSKDTLPKPQRLIPGPAPSNKVSKPVKPDPPLMTVYGPQLPENNKIRGRNGSTDDSGDTEPKVVIQKLRRLKAEADVIVGTREKGPVRKSIDRSRSRSPNERLILKEKGGKGTADASAEEKIILARLCKQVQVLRDLGGEVPNDVKDLIDSETKPSGSSPLASADNIIALIEMEQPPDYKQNDSYLSSLRAAEKSMQNAVFKMKCEKISSNDPVRDTQTDTPKPTSFALIAGYGDDSDQEDSTDGESSPSHNIKQEQSSLESKGRSLFPILEHQTDSNSSDKFLFKDKAKAVPENDSPYVKPSQEPSSKLPLVIDHGSGQKRKKRIDVPSKPTSVPSFVNTKEIAEENGKAGNDGNSSSTSYTTAWSSTSTYTSDPTANDRRGFGFQVLNVSPEEPAKLPSKPQKGSIQFVKAETLIQQSMSDETSGRESSSEMKSKKQTSAKSVEDQELRQHVSSLAQLVVAKLRFLSEGKDPVSPVQAMAIQIETLMSAWNAGALTHGYLQRWLQSTGAELVELERAAAPKGWAVQWDRTYKRYFYCNLATKDTQWDFPVVPETDQKKREELKETSMFETKRQPTPPPEDDEDAMELCTTPPLPEEGEEPEHSPPHSPPAPKRLKTDNRDESNIPSSERAGPQQPPPPLPIQPPLPASPPPPLPSSPPPPPPDTPPPPSSSPGPVSALAPHVTEHGEPLPPGVDTAELPVPLNCLRPSMQPPTVSLTSELGPHLPMNALQAVGPIHTGPVMAAVPVMTTMSIQYPTNVPTTYVPPPPTEAMLASYNHATAVDYMGYMGVYGAPAMPVASVAAPPLTYTGPGPQAQPHGIPQRKKEALLSELNSFYSDIASLDSNSRDAVEDETSQEATVAEQPVCKAAPPPPPAPTGPIHQTLEEPERAPPALESPQPQIAAKLVSSQPEPSPELTLSKKKKKPKLAPGLTLKKKGVSNLVAKWQQVQQEVWKDYQTLSDEDGD